MRMVIADDPLIHLKRKKMRNATRIMSRKSTKDIFKNPKIPKIIADKDTYLNVNKLLKIKKISVYLQPPKGPFWA